MIQLPGGYFNDVLVERLMFLEFQPYSATGIDGKVHRGNSPVLYSWALVDKYFMGFKKYKSLVFNITGKGYSWLSLTIFDRTQWGK